jgi:hypothetical protein
MKEGILMESASIKISSDLISMLGKKLYSSSHMVILARELLQNSIDAVSQTNKPKIEIALTGSMLTVSDNGCGMDNDTLLNVFLCIGGSKKQSNTSVGGFGIAKVCLFASQTWSVYTRAVNSESIAINSDDMIPLSSSSGRYGTIVRGLTSDGYSERDIYKLLHTGNYQIPVFYNGVRIKPYVGKIKWSDDGYCVSVAKPLTLPDDNILTGYIIYRINGLTQFTEYYGDSLQFNVIVDFDCGFRPKDDRYPFDLSRERINYSYSSVICTYIHDQLVKDDITNTRNLDLKTVIRNGYHYIGISPSSISQRDKRIAKVWYAILDTLNVGNYHKGYCYREAYGMRCSDDSNGVPTYAIHPKHYHHLTDSNALIACLAMLAFHEVTHKQYTQHSESFTSSMTYTANDAIQSVMTNDTVKRLAWYALKDTDSA